MGKLYRKILRLLIPKPNKELLWTVEDFNTAKSYAKRLDNPTNPKVSPWDYLNNPWNDSVHILNEVNKIIRHEKKQS